MKDVHELIENRANRKTGQKLRKPIGINRSFPERIALPRGLARVIPSQVFEYRPRNSGHCLSIDSVVNHLYAGALHGNGIRHVRKTVSRVFRIMIGSQAS